MVTAWRSVVDEPRPAHAPGPRTSDWLLVGAYTLAVLVESLARPELLWRPFVTAFALVLVPALLWRRDRPLLATLVGWGAAGVLSAAQLAGDHAELGLQSMVVILILLHALVRWGSGREIVVGTSFVAGVAALGLLAAVVSAADVFGTVVLLLLVVALAAAFRYRDALWQRQQREIRNEERVALARELHDIVAHHVSAIAVQAQAGRVVAGTQPETAAEVLGAIEQEASRTLAEMRSMVRVLRDAEAVDYAPQPGVADLPSLARTAAAPRVEVTLEGPLDGLARPVDTAVYRLAQESLTNAVRHARGATRVAVAVRRDRDVVRLRVSDDGAREPGPVPAPGFGLLGMAERAQLLGGSFSAGPAPDGGWVVEAVLPVEAP